MFYQIKKLLKEREGIITRKDGGDSSIVNQRSQPWIRAGEFNSEERVAENIVEKQRSGEIW